jgi:hypothetical protein
MHARLVNYSLVAIQFSAKMFKEKYQKQRGQNIF